MPLPKKRRTRKLLATNSTYIDPLHCDSLVSYKVINGRSLWGSVQLSDCQDKIEWYFNNDYEGGISKIDRAIEMLTEFREKFSEATLSRKRPRRKVAAR